MTGRAQRVATVVDTLEREMELLCVTGVEDKLQVNVRRTLELLGNAGIKVSVTLSIKCNELVQLYNNCILIDMDVNWR